MSTQNRKSEATLMAEVIAAILRDHPRAMVHTSELRAALPSAPQFRDGVDVAQFAEARGWVADRRDDPDDDIFSTYEFRKKAGTL